MSHQVPEHQRQKVQDPGPHARKFGAYQNEVYGRGMLHGIKPLVTKDPNGLEAQAKEVMSKAAYAYVAGGAGERATMDSNRLAFRQWKLVPRMLMPTTHRDMSVDPGYKTDLNAVFHRDGEKGVAEVAAEVDVPYIASTASSHTIEDIAKANDLGAGDKEAQRWYQLYWPQSEDLTESLLQRAKAAGYKVLIVTLDTWALAWRPLDLDLAWVPFFEGIGNATGFADPVFRKHFAEQSGGKTPEEDVARASQAWIADVFSGAAHSWEDLAHVRRHWDGPILLKGIQHTNDALKAHECGMDGIVVSNHGGRQLDGAIGSLEVLPEIAEAVKDKKTQRDSNQDFTVLFDSGVRTGVDVIKALCLGAHAVLVGRPWVYGLGIGGKRGAKEVLQSILADTDQSMGIAGIQNIADCTKGKVRRVEYGADAKTSN